MPAYLLESQPSCVGHVRAQVILSPETQVNISRGSRLQMPHPMLNCTQSSILQLTFFCCRDEMQDAGIASDTLMKNFFFVPSCIQLSPEDRFSTAA